MAKIYGLFGSMNGKVADVVMAVRNGEQIVRKYQPSVANPSTPAQVEARARLKLMSQLSAVMAPVIAIPRKGSVSSRNMFVKTNYGNSTYSENQANIVVADIQLTRSVLPFRNVIATLSEGNLNVSLAPSDFLDIDRVVYCQFVKQLDNTLRYNGSIVASTAGADFSFAAVMAGSNAETVVYAYGVRDNTETARTVFGDMTVPTAETVAKVIVTRTLLETDITITRTSSVIIPAAT